MHKILIIEDSMMTVMFLRRTIQELFPNAIIVSVKDGKEGFSALKTQAFNLIITDMEMSGGGGLEFVLKMQSNSILKKKKIIIYSAKDKPDLPNSPNVAFVSKLENKQVLIDQIKKFLHETK